MLTCQSKTDIENVNLIATLLSHHQTLGRVRHREFAMGCGEMSETEFTAFLGAVFALLAENTIDGSIHQTCMDWRHIGEMLAAGRTVYRPKRKYVRLLSSKWAALPQLSRIIGPIWREPPCNSKSFV